MLLLFLSGDCCMSVLWRDSLGETLSARSACCYLATSVSEPLFLHNDRLSVAPASLTKVLAAITALQIQPDITLKLIMREGGRNSWLWQQSDAGRYVNPVGCTTQYAYPLQ